MANLFPTRMVALTPDARIRGRGLILSELQSNAACNPVCACLATYLYFSNFDLPVTLGTNYVLQLKNIELLSKLPNYFKYFKQKLLLFW